MQKKISNKGNFFLKPSDVSCQTFFYLFAKEKKTLLCPENIYDIFYNKINFVYLGTTNIVKVSRLGLKTIANEFNSLLVSHLC